MNIEDDIYEDLPDETTSDYIAKIENELESVQKQYDDSQKLIEELSAEKHYQQKRIEELMKKIEDLEQNISSLYKTAVAETKRKDSMLHELRVENDDLAFRRREHRDRAMNCHRNRSRDHSKGLHERYKDGSPTEEKYRYRFRIATESTFLTKRLVDRNSKYDEKYRIEKRNSSEKNGRIERRSNEFHDQEKYHRSRTKLINDRERHSRSPHDRIEKGLDTKNGSEVLNYSDSINKKERWRSQGIHPKSQIKSVIKKENKTVKRDTRLDNASAVTNSSEPRNLGNSRYERLFDQKDSTSYVKNGTHEPNISNQDKRYRIENTSCVKNDLNKLNTSNLTKNLRIENTSSMENHTNKPTTLNLQENDRTENTLSVKNRKKPKNISNLAKNDRTENAPSAKNDTNKPNTSNLNKNQIDITSNMKNDENISNPAKNDRTGSTSNVKNESEQYIFNSNKFENHHLKEEKHRNTVDISDTLDKNASNKFLHKTPAKNLIDEILGQRNCKAALLSMKKQPLKLVSPMKDTPDCLKEKLMQIENIKIDAKIPMINEQRMLSPFKNVGIVEIVSRCVGEVEPTKPSEFETITACSVTISEDVEHGVFSRKSRKRPRIQKIFTGVKKVATC